VLVDPSPKLQDQEVAAPVEASVNCTGCPAVGETGEELKAATGAAPAVPVAPVPPPHPARRRHAMPSDAIPRAMIRSFVFVRFS
jgi:hypothetical protein